MRQLTKEIRRHQTEDILPFWQNLRDEELGGYISYVGPDLEKDPLAERGCILNSRILWFFSQASLSLKDPSLLPYARIIKILFQREIFK